jgi:hypothetical protein
MKIKELLAGVLASLCRLGLGGLFVYSAYAKINDPGIFADAVMRYRILPKFLVGLFSLTIPMLELLAGAGLVFTKWSRESALVVVVMLAMFIVALFQAQVRGLDIACGCFGMPEKAGKFELIYAMVRDVVLLVPAAWLMARRNDWLFAMRRSRALPIFVMALAVLGAGAKTVELNVSSGPVRPGEWNSNFSAVKAEAEKMHRPMVFFHAFPRCVRCARLKKAMAGEAFKMWCEERRPFLAFVQESLREGLSDDGKLAAAFVKEATASRIRTPIIGVYWPREDGNTNRFAFSASPGAMGVAKPEKPLIHEFMTALDQRLADYVASIPGHRTSSQILKASVRTVTCRADLNGAEGKIKMTPKDGILPEGGTVTLEAIPQKSSVFLDWRGPDGSCAGYDPKLEIAQRMPGGCYVGRFKRKSDCRPPIVLSPASTTLVARIGQPFTYKIEVAEESQPVVFDFQADEEDMSVDLSLGLRSGLLRFLAGEPTTNMVTVVILGSDDAHTRTNVILRLISESVR